MARDPVGTSRGGSFAQRVPKSAVQQFVSDSADYIDGDMKVQWLVMKSGYDPGKRYAFVAKHDGAEYVRHIGTHLTTTAIMRPTAPEDSV